jgi:hypothetical protein
MGDIEDVALVGIGSDQVNRLQTRETGSDQVNTLNILEN